MWYALAGGAAGVVNGFFGGGGGMVLVPLLAGKCGLDQRKAFATSVAVIAPLCALSAGIYWFRGDLDLAAALPYLAGGLVGDWPAGSYSKSCPWCGCAGALPCSS
ncbi:MAG: sulfite exporter TauE/SafE family protein, partial [Oscillospiraceae bacterium]|nr:sulfite exporter TauE/SafE family protein [Oscillospiraceae bacterium]